VNTFFRFFLIVSFSFWIFFTNASVSLAEGEFTTELSSVYTINKNTSPTVIHSFTVTNTTPSYYISKYGYQTSLSGITGVSVTNEGSPLEPQIDKTAEKTSISFDFPNEIVGEGKKRNFSIQFSSPVFATLNGKVLEITIPKTQQIGAYTKSSLIVRVPKEFGQPYRIDPSPTTIRDLAGWSEFVYQNYSGQGITAVFGESQRYQLDLTYYLDNPQNYKVSTSLTLPPDTPYQRMLYTNLDPKPENVTLDEDGNWLAEYYLEPLEQKVVTAQAFTELSVNPKHKQLTINESKFTQPLEYWETQDPAIVSLANQYKSPQAIYEVVVDKLDYTELPLTNSRTRYGAAGSLQNAQDAVCQEFTDLFIAIARSNDIPARRATGYAYTNQPELRPLSLDADVLHTWPEYYDEVNQIWKPIDPTWEDTTGGVDYFNFFDLNHIVFAYNGTSSSQPPPAGAFKPLESTEQTAIVTVTSEFPEITSNYSATFENKQMYGAPIPGFFQVAIENQTGKAWYNTSVGIRGQKNQVAVQWLSQDNFPEVFLPFATEKRLIFLTSDQLLPVKDTIIVAITNQSGPTQYVNSETPVIILPYYLARIEFYFGVGIAVSLCALLTGSLLVFRHRRQTVIRRESQEPQTPIV
jgi:transglutaminase-like putative cysteine protease